MSIFAALLQTRTPIIQFYRFRGKINIQRPRAPHFPRQVVIDFTKPFYEPKPINARCLQQKQKQGVLDNPYTAIIAREVKNWLDHSKLVGIFHYNSISSEDLFKVKVQLFRENMHVKTYGMNVLKKAVEGTQYEAILPLFKSKSYFVFGLDDNKVKQLLKITKKVPQWVLLAGIVEGRLMSKNELTDYATMPDLTTVRAQFAAVLDSVGGQLVNNLECHQKNMVNILEAHVREHTKQPDTEKSDEAKPSES